MEMVHFIPPSQRRLALLAAQADSAPALISGASGTGTGTIARWIHLNGPRAGKPLLTANHDRGLILQIPEAQGGTLVVPEIGEWPLGEQAQLLQFLKSRSVPHPDGSGTRMLLNVRIIATTSQALEGRAQGGLFNLELLEKLNVFRLEMPPLAKRAEEFEDITSGIVGEITRELHKQYIKGLSPDAWDALRAYNWPGNLRELRNVLRVAIAAAKGDLLELADLPQFGSDRIDFRATREQFEKIYILELLKTFDYEIEKTCRMTRIDRAQLMAKIRQYGIEIEGSFPPNPH
ncbi:MAG: sigma-54-dependent transcriptional regulator [Bdellovibrionota bacterium]